MLWFIACVTGLVFLYFRISAPFQFWKRKNVAHIRPWLLLGNLASLFKESHVDIVQRCYGHFSGYRYFGFYNFFMPLLVLRDPELIKTIYIKHFENFSDRGAFISEEVDPFWYKNLSLMKGEKWHNMRATLSPAFTSSKMKMMFHVMCECTQDFFDCLQPDDQEIIEIEAKDAFHRLANDVMASTVFGVQCNSVKKPENKFFTIGKGISNFGGIKQLKLLGCYFSPKLMKWLSITIIDQEEIDFFGQVINESKTIRNETELVRPDILHILIEAQKKQLKYDNDDVDAEEEFRLKYGNAYREIDLTDENITAQCVLLFLAGYGTTAITLSNAAYELAVNSDIQEKLIREIDDALERCDGRITYQKLFGMIYLDMVVSETLRLRPVLSIAYRMCVKPFVIESALPHEHPLEIQVGDEIGVPIFALHRDPKHYPMPDKFDPERFSQKNKHNIRSGSYLPFGIGPRNCIGNRFALMEVKIAIFYMLSRFRVITIDNTPIPLLMSKSCTMLIHSDKGYWLGLQSRKLD